MDTARQNEVPNIAQFPMKKPEMQIGTPAQTVLPEVKEECEFARNIQTWD